MGEVGYEVDFLPVGNGDRSGDAIAIRYGVPGDYKVLVYDGGTKESGQKLVDHIIKYYKTRKVDYMVSSHPDADHASGLSVVLEQLNVGELWMHRPWAYSSIILDYFKDGRITDKSLEERLKEKIKAAYDLEQTAVRLGIPVYEPFEGQQIGAFDVLSPEEDWYVHELIPGFEKSPASVSVAEHEKKAFAGVFGRAISWIKAKWDTESLREDVETSSENESSVVLYGSIDGRGIMLTGDAGVCALTAAVDFTESRGVSLPSELRVIQVPHHGSRRNVSTEVLDRLVGPRKTVDDGETTKTAMVSASKESTVHPRKVVRNAFLRRGAKFIPTEGESIRYNHNMPKRDGWTSVSGLGFSDEEEGWD